MNSLEVTRETLLSLPTLLRDARTARGVGIRQAGAEIGCGFSTVSKIERGVHSPSLALAESIILWLLEDGNDPAS